MIYQFNSIKFENCRAQQLGTVISTVPAKASLRTAKPFWSQRLTNQIASLNNSVKKFLTWIHRFSLTALSNGVQRQSVLPAGPTNSILFDRCLSLVWPQRQSYHSNRAPSYCVTAIELQVAILFRPTSITTLRDTEISPLNR